MGGFSLSVWQSHWAGELPTLCPASRDPVELECMGVRLLNTFWQCKKVKNGSLNSLTPLEHDACLLMPRNSIHYVHHQVFRLAIGLQCQDLFLYIAIAKPNIMLGAALILVVGDGQGLCDPVGGHFPTGCGCIITIIIIIMVFCALDRLTFKFKYSPLPSARTMKHTFTRCGGQQQ